MFEPVAMIGHLISVEINTTGNLAPAHTHKGTSMESFLGQIQLFPYNFAPANWAFCEGQELAINQNNALFALLGTTYGGNGTSTFALPNLKGKEPAPYMHYCIALQGIFPSRG